MTNKNIQTKPSYNVAIFASGAGSNALKIIEFFSENEYITVSLIVCNKINAGVLDIASTYNIESIIVDKNHFNSDELISRLHSYNIDLIVLAGFLWKIPETLISNYKDRIINIHPALLPKFGGKGMYGNNVHEAIVRGNEIKSGISIHLVDEHYDHGRVLFQAVYFFPEHLTAASLASQIHILEHRHYPVIINSYIQNCFPLNK